MKIPHQTNQNWLVGLFFSSVLASALSFFTAASASGAEYARSSTQPLTRSSTRAYPTDPTVEIPWSAGFSGVSDIESAFNNARSVENSQLGTSVPSLSLPNQATWNGMSSNEKTIYIINKEREDRGVHLLHGTESNVIGVAQAYAQFLMDNNATGHDADGSDPWSRLEANTTINECHDFLSVAENLYYRWTTGDSISLPLERAIYS